MHEFRNSFIGMQSSTRLLNYNCGIRGGWQSAAGFARARVLARARAGPRGGNLLFAVVDKLVLHLTLL